MRILIAWLKANSIKRVLVILLITLFTFGFLAYFVQANQNNLSLNKEEYQSMSFDGTYDWEKEPNSFTSSSDYMTYSDLHNIFITSVDEIEIGNSLTSIQFIRFDTAEELYQFSIDVSFSNFIDNPSDTEMADKIAYLLSLDYVLGKDIDYSIMRSRAFKPIGYKFVDTNSTSYENVFTGSFDGQGFEIKNLYLAGHDDIVYEEQQGEETIYTPIASYYSMFTHNEGVVKNVGLVNPNLEILQVNTDLTKLANLVGENSLGGIVDHVYVIDNRESVTEAGIRYNVGSSSLDFEAAGIIHTNNGDFSNSYYTSKVVVNGNYINKFSLEPLYFTNTGNTSQLVYDSDVYLLEVAVGSSTFTISQPQNGFGESTVTMKSNLSSLSLGDWYFYSADRYPSLKGLIYDSVDGYYEISSAKDLAFFSELLRYNTEINGNRFANSNYKLTTNIDMSVLAPGVYNTPDITFNGSFIGTNSLAIDNSDHYYIYNLVINEYIVLSSDIYVGLFSILGNGSLIKDINFIDSAITLGNTAAYYSYEAHVGSIAGEMIAGTIEDVYVDVDITLGSDDIGATNLGGIVGKASGNINRASYNGLIDFNQHSYNSNNPIIGNYYIGGVVGRTGSAKLIINEAVNNNSITSLSTTSSINLDDDTPNLNVYTGGVIGYSYHSAVAQHEMINVANRGNIILNPITNPDTLNGNQYAGGIFGQVAGIAPDLELNQVIKFANFYNQGQIVYTFASDSIAVISAGIGTSNFDSNFELALMTNEANFSYDYTGASLTTTNFDYASILYDVGSYDVIVSRAYSYGNMTYDNNIYSRTFDFVETNETNDLTIRYSANYGDITYMSASTITVNQDLDIYIFSNNENVNYLNNHNYGNINVVNVNMQGYDLYISGFTKRLTDSYYIKNSLNVGNIVFADILGTGNIYVSGFVNINNSGDLHLAGQSTEQPKANYGIINSINYGSISTTYDASTYGVDGTNNTFVGGLSTLNKGSIQDSANLGNISLLNTSSAGSTTFETELYLAGLVSYYSAGVVAGGVSAIVLDGNSRIYDSSNNGDVIAKAEEFVRTGGVLGVSLYEEALSGGITSGMGLVDNIQNSVLSNGFNFGNISAITSVIGYYDPTYLGVNLTYLYAGTPPETNYNLTYSTASTNGTQDRPPVYAAAGGVIGYGLSYMQRMLNHGLISSTDVAGGVVGATYALGASSGTTTTVVNITTAVNYGDIKSIDNGDYALIGQADLNSTGISGYYMADSNNFIYPSGFTQEAPSSKRGFGGIFGRLQRGLNGYMTSSGGAFDFIVNANPNIDLIGRLDQVTNFSSSLRFFIFNDAIYYSAKDNDTTQTVFSGFLYNIEEVTSVTYLGYEDGTLGSKYDFIYEITTEEIIYHQQGDRNTVYSSVATTFEERVGGQNTNNPTPSSYTVGQVITPETYISTAPTPWITEDPSDPLITDITNEYMYDENFPMRTNPDLTEYIYFAETDLLATRFKVGGTNPRPNGMYVLSTTAGQTFGLVLPNNISINNIELIDESLDLSLDSDYDSISSSDTVNLNQAIIDKYNGLRQTEYNDKANLIDDSQNQDFTLEEVNGSENVLNIPTIDYQNNVITFSISMEAFNPLQTTVTFDITRALTSANALIGIKESEYGSTTTDLQDELYLERYTDIATASTTKANLSVALPSQTITATQTLTLGYFSVYSEAFVMDIADGTYEFTNSDYYNDYRIDINFLPNIMYAGNYSGVDSVSFNGGATIDIADSYFVDLRSVGDVSYNGSLTLNFVDYNSLFGDTYDFKDYFVVKFNDGTIVDESYYTVSSIPFNSGNYSVTFVFDQAIKSGDYYLEYSYYPLSYTYRIDFDKSSSPNKELIDFTYYSENNSVPEPITTSFTSYINLGQTLTPDSGNFFTITSNSASVSYLSPTYDVSYMISGSLEISDFAEIISAELTGITYTNGYKSYHLEYVIQAEDMTQVVYYHTLTEREITIEEVQKNDNFVDIDNVFALREDLNTEFVVDLGFEEPLVEDTVFNYGDPNVLFTINITGTDPDGLSIATGDITGISYSFSEFLEIDMSISTLPGTYSFEILYSRGTGNGEVDIRTATGTYLQITKKEGQNAYFPDLLFSTLATETLYPEIGIGNGSNVPGELLENP
ncbi:MAG: hypothetical protein K9L64_06665, partial [Candidatus Izimaplasma sp.]|nr:hypothetical protein [Candidatus Izimaplasma bacterium]